MNTEKNNTVVEKEDIDLVLLVERALRFLRRFGWLLLAALLVGLATGFLMYKIIPRTYKSRLVVHSSVLSNPEQLQVVDSWNQLLKEKDYKTLAAQFGCTEDLLKSVKQLKAKEIQQVFTPNNPNGFTVDATVTDNKLLPELQKAVTNGFENTEYVKERLAVKKAGLEQLIVKTEQEIKKLDSTKTIVQDIISGASRSASQLIVDGSSINRQLIEMNEKLLGFKESLEFTKAVQVLKSFTPSKRPAGPGWKVFMSMGAITFLCLAWIVAMIISVNEKLKKRRLEYPLH